MPQVQTVTGPVETAELGPTLMHEHVFVLTADVQQNYPEEWGSEDERVADAVARLTALAATGVRTIVDPTVIGLGRYIPRIQRIAEQVDLNIVVATGCYTYVDVPFFFHYRGPALNAAVGAELPDPMVDMFVGDIEQGIAGTGVRAAFLKCAIDHQGMTSGVERVMRAVGKAHRRTGVPITVHTNAHEQTGRWVVELLRSENADLTKVVIGHSGDSGALLGMDRFGVDAYRTTADRVATIVALCQRGYAERMVLSQDASCYIDWLAPGVMDLLPQWHYTHIHDDVLPYVRERGVTEEQIETMLVANPRRYFENVGSY